MELKFFYYRLTLDENGNLPLKEVWEEGYSKEPVMCAVIDSKKDSLDINGDGPTIESINGTNSASLDDSISDK